MKIPKGLFGSGEPIQINPSIIVPIPFPLSSQSCEFCQKIFSKMNDLPPLNRIFRVGLRVAVVLLMGRGTLHAEQRVVTVTNYVAEAALPTVSNMTTVVSNGTTRVALTAPAQQVSTHAVVVTPLDAHGNVEVKTSRGREVVNPFVVSPYESKVILERKGRDYHGVVYLPYLLHKKGTEPPTVVVIPCKRGDWLPRFGNLHIVFGDGFSYQPYYYDQGLDIIHY